MKIKFLLQLFTIIGVLILVILIDRQFATLVVYDGSDHDPGSAAALMLYRPVFLILFYLALLFIWYFVFAGDFRNLPVSLLLLLTGLILTLAVVYQFSAFKTAMPWLFEFSVDIASAKLGLTRHFGEILTAAGIFSFIADALEKTIKLKKHQLTYICSG